MKKVLLVITVLIMLNCFSVSAVASTANTQTTLYLTDNFSTYYFSNLDTNYGVNWKGSCGYIAMAMLLSYYDTYWNDNFIDEDQDQPCTLPTNSFSYQTVSSPGIKREPSYVVSDDMTPEEYKQACFNNRYEYLHMYLLDLGGDYVNENIRWGRNLGSLTPGAVSALLQTYIEERETKGLQQGAVVESVIKSEGSSEEDIRRFAINHIKQGIPVILGMQKRIGEDEYIGHAMIAYDYDSSLDIKEEDINGEIFVHDGLTNTHFPLKEAKYTGYLCAIALNMEGIFHDCIHACSDNYQYTNPITNKTTTYCPCDLPIHPEYEPPILPPPFNPPVPQQPPVHVHDEYWDVCEDWHSYNCETCELSGIEESHDFIPKQGEYLVDDEHLLVCHCGYTSYGYCSYTAVIRFHDCLTHRKYCACGAYESYNHAFVSAPTSASYNWICIGCGATSNSTTMPTPQSLVSGDVMMQMNSSGVITLPDGTTLQILTETGSYVLSNGIIVLSDEDAALVEAGLLDPYELVENITVPAGPGHVTE